MTKEPRLGVRMENVTASGTPQSGSTEAPLPEATGLKAPPAVLAHETPSDQGSDRHVPASVLLM